jgi:CysZ protein
MPEPAPAPGRPGLLRRAAAGAWHVPAGFVFLLRHPRLWPLAALPAFLAAVLLVLGGVAGVYLGPSVEARFGPQPGQVPVWVELPAILLLWTATIGAGVFVGIGLAFLLAAPLLEQLSRKVEARVLGHVVESSLSVGDEVVQSLRGSLYFLAAAPGVLLLGFIPVVGPFLSAAWGGRAVAFQMTDPALSRRGLSFRQKREWHRDWFPESQGFGLAGMVALLVPLANLVLGPALVAGGTLLVMGLEELEPPRPREVEALAGAEPSPGLATTA